ncbi:MAG: sugar ABC transporter permease [Chloroflexota bacterium]|nr:MAG: sugar ABC transporter permease [Chloroflexota bacterium]
MSSLPDTTGHLTRQRPWTAVLRSDRFFWAVCLVPPFAILAAVFVYPLAVSFQSSLTNESILTETVFIGLRNYQRALADANAMQSLRFTLLFSTVCLVVQMVVGFVLAALLQKITIGRGLFRTLVIIPLMLTPVVMALQWRMMMNYDFGILNYFVGLLGFEPQGWTLNPTAAFVSVVLVDTWHNVGFVAMLISAGMATLPTEPFEAAEVDGASAWQRLWHLTVPLLRPVIVVALLFRAYGLLRTFDLIFALTQGGPGRATETFSYHIYQSMFLAWQIGYSSALGYILLAITLAVCVVLIFFVDVEEDV